MTWKTVVATVTYGVEAREGSGALINMFQYVGFGLCLPIELHMQPIIWYTIKNEAL